MVSRSGAFLLGSGVRKRGFVWKGRAKEAVVLKRDAYDGVAAGVDD